MKKLETESIDCFVCGSRINLDLEKIDNYVFCQGCGFDKFFWDVRLDNGKYFIDADMRDVKKFKIKK